ncbi:MAG: HAMP domain-containing protein, partial [Planctomycetia bacterium]|nr:HAMP domain-containing protein [Planctomycetia bacterium]
MQRSIAGRLLFWFLVIALIPCAILTATTARIATRALENSVRNNLVQIAAAKAGELEAYAIERVRDGMATARGPTVVRAVQELTSTLGKDGGAANPDRVSKLTAAGRQFEDFLGYVASSFGYTEVLLLDAAGTVLFSLDKQVPVGSSVEAAGGTTSELALGCDRSRTLLQSELSGFQAYGSARRPLAFVTSPVFAEGRVIGVLALGLGPERVWQVLSDLTGLGRTGEIVTGEQQGQAVLVTCPLRHAPDAAFKLQIPLGGDRGGATQKASSGARGYGIVRDYRGTDVVAAWCYLPSFRWGMSVKQDASEAFALVNFQRAAIIGLSLATILGVTIAALAVARTISAPIRTAVDVARQVAGGDLRATVGAASDDETGALLTAIQTMTN